jgi:predicted nuclease of predicted toxin-antitoxin system
VKLLGFRLLCDENIALPVIDSLQRRGCDVRSVEQERLIGCADRDVLHRATAQDRVVVTHDLLFGKAAINAGEPFVGIVYLRPGHISADFVLTLVDALLGSPIDLQPPFVVVAERRHSTVRVRVRTEPPW